MLKDGSECPLRTGVRRFSISSQNSPVLGSYELLAVPTLWAPLPHPQVVSVMVTKSARWSLMTVATVTLQGQSPSTGWKVVYNCEF